jgi:hypothetical protein
VPQLNRIFTIPSRADADGEDAEIELDWDFVSMRDLADWSGLGPLGTRILGRRRGSVYVLHGGNLRASRSGAGLPQNVVKQICLRPQKGLFSVVSGVSPTGGPDFEDLAIVGGDDHAEALLVVVTQDGNSFTVYRRLFRDHHGTEGGRE